MQFFTGLEAYGLSRGDADFGSGSRVAADAGFACANAEYTETAQFNAFACSERFLEPFKHSIDCRFGLGAGQACALDHMVHDVLFNQNVTSLARLFSDCTTPYRTDGTAFGSFVEHRWRSFLHIVTRCGCSSPKAFL